jgi:hypothetical protein
MLEALHTLISIIFREADPNLTYALEPVTMGLMAGSALLKAITGKMQSGMQSDAFRDQAEADALRAETAIGEADRMIEAAERRRADYGLGPSFTDLRRMVMEDPTSDYLRREAAKTEAKTLDALKYGGARSLAAGTQSATQQTLDNLSKIAADEQMRKAQGLGIVGGQEQRVAEQKLVDARTDLMLGRGLRAEGLAQKYGSEDMMRFGDVQKRMGNLQFGSDLLGAGIDIAMQTDWGQGKGSGGGLKNLFGGGGGGGNLEWSQRMASEGGTGGTSGGGGVDFFSGSDPYAQIDIFGRGGRTFEEGGELMRDQETPGEFSHKNNPIDIMQDGAKIGEMTGGEGIVSPQDMGDWEQEAAKGNTPLHRKIRAWFRKINQKDNG